MGLLGKGESGDTAPTLPHLLPVGFGSWWGCKEESELLPTAREFVEARERTERTPQERWARPTQAMALGGTTHAVLYLSFGGHWAHYIVINIL